MVLVWRYIRLEKRIAAIKRKAKAIRALYEREMEILCNDFYGYGEGEIKEIDLEPEKTLLRFEKYCFELNMRQESLKAEAERLEEILWNIQEELPASYLEAHHKRKIPH